jgi:hypothetical protein
LFPKICDLLKEAKDLPLLLGYSLIFWQFFKTIDENVQGEIRTFSSLKFWASGLKRTCRKVFQAKQFC